MKRKMKNERVFESSDSEDSDAEDNIPLSVKLDNLVENQREIDDAGHSSSSNSSNFRLVAWCCETDNQFANITRIFWFRRN